DVVEFVLVRHSLRRRHGVILPASHAAGWSGCARRTRARRAAGRILMARARDRPDGCLAGRLAWVHRRACFAPRHSLEEATKSRCCAWSPEPMAFWRLAWASRTLRRAWRYWSLAEARLACADRRSFKRAVCCA